MKGGEIDASVVVVKEIEVPFGMVELVARRGGGEGKRREKGKVEDGDTDTEARTETEIKTESPSDTDGDDLSGTVVLERDALFAIHLESDLDEPVSQPRFAVDLEIAWVFKFKPRPVRTRVHNHLHVAGTGGGKNMMVKKPKHLMPLSRNEHGVGSEMGNGDGNGDAMERNKAHNRRQARDRKREDKRRALTAFAAQSVGVAAGSPAVVTIEEPATLTVPSDGIPFTGVEVSSIISSIDISLEVQQDLDGDNDDDDDGFAPPTTATPFSTFPTAPGGESFLKVPATALAFPTTFSSGAGSVMNGGKAEKGETTLIVEALVVRKMALEEAFLDFGGFSLT